MLLDQNMPLLEGLKNAYPERANGNQHYRHTNNS